MADCSPSSAQEETRLPPGTFHLFKHLESTETDILLLDPAPSDDPNDPLNWSTWRKAVNFSLITAVTIIVFTGLSIQLLFWQQMVPDLNANYTQLNNAVSVNNVGLSMGCVLFIPLARKYGRRSTYVVSTAVMAAMAFWSARMKTIPELYITQLITGLAGATNETIVQMTIADLFFVHHRGSMNAIYIGAVMIGSFLTSIPAGVQGADQRWRWSYWTLAIVNTVVFFLFLFFYEETKYVPVVNGLSTVRTASQTDKAGVVDTENLKNTTTITTPEAEYIRAQPRINHNIPMNSWRVRLRWTTKTDVPYFRTLYRPFIVLFNFPHIMFTALQYASGVVWLTILSSILSISYSAPPYNFSSAGIGYMGVGPFIGNTFGSLYGGVLGDWMIKYLARRNNGYFEPEFRLYLLYLPAILMAAGLIMFGATTDKGLNWIYPSIGGALFGFGLGAIGDAALTLIIDTYIEITGDAFVGIAFVRNVFGIAVPFTITPWLRTTSLTNIFITCGFISLAISALFVPLIFYGKRIRTALAGRYEAMLVLRRSHRED